MSSAQKKESNFDKEADSAPKSKNSKNAFYKHPFVLPTVLVIALVAALAIGGYYFLQYQKSRELLKNPAQAGQMETKKLIERVGKLVELPTDEEPTIATVSDITKLKSQSFFQHAANGDKVLIYQKAKKAILYRPSTNKLVEFGPINIGSAEQNSASPSAALTPTPVVLNIILRNGTKTVGFAATVEKDLKIKDPSITVVSKDNAKNNYTKTLIIDLKGTQKEASKRLVNLLNGELGELPVGETKPQNADFLVILGKQP